MPVVLTLRFRKTGLFFCYTLLLSMCGGFTILPTINAQNATLKCLDETRPADYYLIRGIRTSIICHDTSLYYYSLAMDMAESANDTMLMAIGHFHLGELLQDDISNLNQSIWHFRKAIVLSDSNTCRSILARAYWALGRIYALMPEKQDSVMILFDLAASARNNFSRDYNSWWIDMAKFNYYRSIDNHNMASEFLEEALSLTRIRSKKKDHGYLLTRATEYYRAIGALEKHQQLFQEYMTKFGTLKGRSEFERINQRDYVVQMANELKLAQLSIAKRKNIIAVLVVLVLTILTLLGYYGWYKNRKLSSHLMRNNDIIENSLLEKSVLLKEIHHRVKNNLQVISSLLYLQGEYVEDEAASKALQEGQNRVKSMALIHKNLYQEENLVGIDMKSYFDKLIESLFLSYKTSIKNIRLIKDIQAISLDVDTVIPIALIVNELISNSLEHAFSNNGEGELNILLKEEENGLLLAVWDDGQGLPKHLDLVQSDSFGFELIRLFAEKLDAQLSVRNENGCDIRLMIKNYKRA